MKSVFIVKSKFSVVDEYFTSVGEAMKFIQGLNDLSTSTGLELYEWEIQELHKAR